MQRRYIMVVTALMAQLASTPSWADDAWLGWAWEMENVPFTRTTATDGAVVYIACRNVATVNDCVRSDSLVDLADGSKKPISTIRIGDRLRGPEGDAQVISVNRTDGAAFYYRINDFKFAITGDHPILTTDGLKAADDTMKYKDVVVGRLEVGDKMITKTGEIEVTSITAEKPKKGTNAVNIRTAGDRAFFVDGVAVKPFKDITFQY